MTNMYVKIIMMTIVHKAMMTLKETYPSRVTKMMELGFKI